MKYEPITGRDGMKLTLKELRNAFVAGCNRQSNLSLGVSFFQDFEIASFLNNAYLICVNKRLGIHDDRFISVSERDKIQPSASFPNDLKDLIDFGDLYIAEPMVQEVKPPVSSGRMDVGFGQSNYFYSIDVTGTGGMIPYFLSVNFYEFWDSNPDREIPSVSRPCKPVALTDVPKLALVYQSNRYMPYLYYRLRKIARAQEDGSVHLWPFIQVHYYSEAPRGTATTSYISYDAVRYPRRIKFDDFTKNGERQIEVAFGFEIATRAIQIAMESLTSGNHAGTLQQMEGGEG